MHNSLLVRLQTVPTLLCSSHNDKATTYWLFGDKHFNYQKWKINKIKRLANKILNVRAIIGNVGFWLAAFVTKKYQAIKSKCQRFHMIYALYLTANRVDIPIIGIIGRKLISIEEFMSWLMGYPWYLLCLNGKTKCNELFNVNSRIFV